VSAAAYKPIVHIVWGGGIVLAAYAQAAADSAELHARCVTGALVTSVELLERVPPEILSDLETEFEGQNEDDTPVVARTLTVEDLDDAKPEPKPRQ
jgi:hypothetical protein